MGDHPTDYQAKTRTLRPVDAITFTDQEMMNGVLSSVSPASVVSIAQLHGERRGVVRLTCKSPDAARDLDGRVASRRVQINGVRVAPVCSDSGHFVRLVLADVPQYVSSEDVERELTLYGNVVHVRREFVEFQGYRLENETRHVLLSSLLRDIPSRIKIDGNEIFVTQEKVPWKEDSKAYDHGTVRDTQDFISQSTYIPKHVMTSVYTTTTEGMRRAASNNDLRDSCSGRGTTSEHIQNKPGHRHSTPSFPNPKCSRKHHSSYSTPSRESHGDCTNLVGRKLSKEGRLSASSQSLSTKSDRRLGTAGRADIPRRRSRPDQLLPTDDVAYSDGIPGLSRRRSLDYERDRGEAGDPHLDRYTRSMTPEADTHI